MNQNRIIPVLLLHKNQIYKTIQFKNPVYIGDPINTVKIFNEKEVDEILILDIDASINRNAPNFELIKKIAAECEMPVTYGGGISEIWHAEKIITSGIEKISTSSTGLLNPEFIQQLAIRLGSQSVSITLDVFKNKNDYELKILNGSQSSRESVQQTLEVLSLLDICEIVINSINRDGTMAGYDISFAEKIKSIFNCQITLLGGAGSIDDLKFAAEKLGNIGLAAGSLFIYQGKFKAVLPSYVNSDDRLKIEISKNIH
jgi:cyclase